MRIRKIVVGAIALSGVLAACSADKTDYKEAAEKAIKDALKEQDENATADCDDPESKDVGTTFDCTGTVNGVTLSFVAEIDKKDHVTVNGGDVAPTQDTTATEDTTSEEESS
jgi:hypothetical protein